MMEVRRKPAECERRITIKYIFKPDRLASHSLMLVVIVVTIVVSLLVMWSKTIHFKLCRALDDRQTIN